MIFFGVSLRILLEAGCEGPQFPRCGMAAAGRFATNIADFRRGTLEPASIKTKFVPSRHTPAFEGATIFGHTKYDGWKCKSLPRDVSQCASSSIADTGSDDRNVISDGHDNAN